MASGEIRNGWQPFEVTTPSCGRAVAIAYGLATLDVVGALRTLRCTAARDFAIVAPIGAPEMTLLRAPGATMISVRYERADEVLTVTAWPSTADALTRRRPRRQKCRA